MQNEFLILGCGYTGRRVARRLVEEGKRVVCTNRKAKPLAGATCLDLDAADPASLKAMEPHLSPGMKILYSIPDTSQTEALLELLRPLRTSRILYLSTTGVYGAAGFVDAGTVPAPETERDRLRLKTEGLIAEAFESSLVLRPAAIYGPGRGVHTSAYTGVLRLPPGGDRMVSRIHVDDLADHVFAGLNSNIRGEFPIADEEPCSSSQVAAFAFELLGRPFCTGQREESDRDRSRAGRRVDGSAYRRALGLGLLYPSYRQGVPACLQDEASNGVADSPGVSL